MEEGGASDASESADDDEENVAETLTQLREEEQKDLKRLNIGLLWRHDDARIMWSCFVCAGSRGRLHENDASCATNWR